MGARAAYHVHAVAADEGGEAAPPTFQRLFSIQHTDFHSDARLFAEPQSAHRVNAILQRLCVFVVVKFLTHHGGTHPSLFF